MARQRQTYTKMRGMTLTLTEKNALFLERIAEYYGISINETVRRLICDTERTSQQRTSSRATEER